MNDGGKTMHLKQHRKIIFALTIGYTLFILYFLFFAFGRVGKVDHNNEYTFIFLPDDFFRVPGLSDLLHPTLMDFVGFGNIAAFIPFGILIPLLYRTNFVRFMTLFILSILVLETIQALTLLGSFDMLYWFSYGSNLARGMKRRRGFPHSPGAHKGRKKRRIP